MMDSASLNTEFGLAKHLRFEAQDGNILALIDIPGAAQAVVSLFGAHPVEPGLPAHGVARIRAWRVIASGLDNDVVMLKFGLNLDQDPLIPQPVGCEVTLRIGATLSIDVRTHNRGQSEFVFTEALHSYFSISNIEAISVDGLDTRQYLDQLNATAGLHTQAGSIRFSGETDRIYLRAEDRCVINDPSWGRRLRIAKHGSQSTVVWNPWIDKAAAMGDFPNDDWPYMVCVESGNCLTDRITLQACQSHVTGIRIDVETLAPSPPP